MNNAANDDMDVLIRNAFDCTAIPDGALERSMSALRLAAAKYSTDSWADDAAAAPVVPPAEVALVTPAKVAGTRRSWIAYASSVAIAVSVIFAVFALRPGNGDLSAESIISGASSLAESAALGQIDWKTTDLDLPPFAAQQLAVYDMQLEPTGKASVKNRHFGSTRSRVLNIWMIRSHNSERDGLWIEVDKTSSINELVSAMKPLTNTGKWSVAAMQSEGRLFVFVCQGDVSHFLRQTSYT